MSRLLLVAASVFVVNLPFGFWRAGVPRLSRPWFLAVHLPVPLVILLRWASGLGFHLATFPVMVGAFFAGQLAGGMLRRARRPWSPSALRPAGDGGEAASEPRPSTASDSVPPVE
jgi:hypothetical protein